MENASVKERILEFLRKEGISVTKTERLLGWSKSALLKSNNVSGDKIAELVHLFPYLSTDWLLTGEGEMLKSEETTSSANQVVSETRPRIPYTAAAGSLTNSVDGVTAMQCEQIPVITAFPAYDFTIMIKGNSMYPYYEGGDEVACKRVDNTSFIQWGKVYVMDTEQGIVIKRVYEDGEGIRCVSYNKEYPDFTIAKSEIYSMSLVVGLLRI